ncbi:MAG: type I DNA topoisomerase [Coprobacillus sp.]|nr:type I DNA topoisomerase [Coprobacillus sp.]
MKLVIVESPGKVDKISHYLGKDYKVACTKGHIRDLVTRGKGGFGIDIKNDYRPIYTVKDEKSQEVVNSLKEEVKQAEEVIIATDPDREGEAIAWHVCDTLNLDPKTTKRVEFHEITQDGIKEGMANPRTIDMDLVASQEARRVVDRVLGFSISGWLNNLIKSESAGRVQSPTLKLITDHDKEIDEFISETYYNVNISISLDNQECKLVYDTYKGKKDKIKKEEEAKKVLDSIGESISIDDIKFSKRSAKAKIPYDTAAMQEDASTKLGISTIAVQNLAEQLFLEGYITYIRTDYTRLAPSFIYSTSKYIEETYGKEYVGYAHSSKKSETTQDAHEAIRPTDIKATPESLKDTLSGDKYRLYQLIYNHTLKSLMKPKEEDVETIYFKLDNATYHLEFSKTTFKGDSIIDGKDNNLSELPSLKVGDTFKVLSKELEEKQTEPPEHYSEGKVVNLMKKEGIGRPSTYGNTIKVLKERGYVEKRNDGFMVSTEKGKKTSTVLNKYFPNVVDTKYTASMETELDQIGNKEKTYKEVVKESIDLVNFYKEEAKNKAYKEPDTPTGELCPICGSPLVYKKNKKGQEFIGCSNFPACSYIKQDKPEDIYTGETCPKCGSPLVKKKNKKGDEFIGCSNFPACDYIKKEAPVIDTSKLKKCPKCETGYLVKKRGPYGAFLACNNPECDYKENFKKKRYYSKK